MPHSSPTESKQLFIQHLAERLEQMDCGAVRVQPIAYRLYARRLREALADYPPGRQQVELARRYPAVAEALATRHFNAHGWLPGSHAGHARAITELALVRMRQPVR